MLSPEHHSVQMSKITIDDLTQSGTECSVAVTIWQQWLSEGYCQWNNWQNLVSISSGSSKQHLYSAYDKRSLGAICSATL